MSDHVISTSLDEDPMHVIAKMFVYRFNNLPVLDEGKLVGLINMHRLMSQIFKHAFGANASMEAEERRSRNGSNSGTHKALPRSVLPWRGKLTYEEKEQPTLDEARGGFTNGPAPNEPASLMIPTSHSKNSGCIRHSHRQCWRTPYCVPCLKSMRTRWGSWGFRGVA